MHCAECYSQSLLLELILSGLREHAGTGDGAGATARARDLGVFAQQVAQIIKSRGDEQTTYIVRRQTTSKIRVSANTLLLGQVLDQAEHLVRQGLVSATSPGGLLSGLISIESLVLCLLLCALIYFSSACRCR